MTIRSTNTSFAIATRDELWINGRLAERRLSCGSATDEGGRIVAVGTIDEELIRACDREIDELRNKGEKLMVERQRRSSEEQAARERQHPAGGADE